MSTRIAGIICLVLAAVLVASSLYAAGIGLTTETIHNNGNIATIQAYFDSQCTQPTDMLNWSGVIAISTNTKTLWLQNLGDSTINGLNLTITNWTPTQSVNYMNVTWDREGTTLAGHTTIDFTVTLNVFATSSDLVNFGSDFSFDIVITGIIP